MNSPILRKVFDQVDDPVSMYLAEIGAGKVKNVSNDPGSDCS
jgi:hypothetical protein